ncbi:MAG: DUF819 family protein [Deltaproteobacteria bacterium]|nr:DUF819 family protein [Deltaproteobacteria bacterium]
MTQALLIVFFVGFPALAVHGAKHSKLLEWLSPVILCYGAGIALANFLPSVMTPENKALASSFTEGTVLLAVPMLLFNTDVMAWLRSAGSAVLSFVLAVISVLVCTCLAALLVGGKIDRPWDVSGMLVGVYTGGTPNMTAIGKALEVPDELFLLVNLVDVALSGAILIFYFSVAKHLLALFLPEYPGDKGEETVDLDDASVVFSRSQLLTFAKLIAMSLGIAGAGVGVSLLLTGQMSVAVIILTVTTGGLALSFIDKVRDMPGSFELGEYILLIFCVAIGTLADVSMLAEAGGPLMLYGAVALYGALLMHFILAGLFRIDVDTVMITSTAAIFGPAFVGPIAGVLGNRKIVTSGLATGLVGYAIGNYLGLAVAALLKAMLT